MLVAGFAPASASEEDTSFATGLVIDLRTSLSLWRWFPVIGPEAIGWQTDRDGDLRATAREVYAAYAISSAIRRSGARIRVTTRLIETATGHLIWSETFDGEMTEIFEMQEAIARVAREIGRAEAARIVRQRPTNMTAWQLVAQTDELDRTGGEGYGTAASNAAQVPLLDEAIRLEPDYARALARLGRYYFRSALQGWVEDRESSFAKGLELFRRAVELDPTEWEAQTYLAPLLILGQHAFGPARFHAEEGVRLNPSAPTARHGPGCALEWLGEPEQALHHLQKLFELNPNWFNRAAVLGDITTCQLMAGKTAEAADTARLLRDIAPDYLRGLQRVIVSLAHDGATDEAAEALARVTALQQDFDEAYVCETCP